MRSLILISLLVSIPSLATVQDSLSEAQEAASNEYVEEAKDNLNEAREKLGEEDLSEQDYKDAKTKIDLLDELLNKLEISKSKLEALDTNSPLASIEMAKIGEIKTKFNQLVSEMETILVVPMIAVQAGGEPSEDSEPADTTVIGAAGPSATGTAAADLADEPPPVPGDKPTEPGDKPTEPGDEPVTPPGVGAGGGADSGGGPASPSS